jgi:phosphoribosyl 1,2-cyclic phosphodiesterase
MRFASLGSGSEGNALVVSAGSTRVLMDCGFGLQETERRLARLGLQASHLGGIVVTHEHGDHISGVARLAKRHGLPVWLTHGTRRKQHRAFDQFPNVTEILPDQTFSIGDIELMPYSVPHDAAEPVQYVFSDGLRRLGVLTDAGHVTPHIRQMLDGCDALMIECNHDLGMLHGGSYPPSLKQRVGGRYGHMNNQQAAELLGQLDVSGLQHLVVAHLSQQNNRQELAVQAMAQALNCEERWVVVATQAFGLDWREIA